MDKQIKTKYLLKGRTPAWVLRIAHKAESYVKPLNSIDDWRFFAFALTPFLTREERQAKSPMLLGYKFDRTAPSLTIMKDNSPLLLIFLQ